jgi:WD40 repeat protein
MSTSDIPPEAKALPDPPTDGVSALKFLSSSLLASTSWDGSVRVHNVDKMEAQLSHNMESGPLLSLTTLKDDSNIIITGGLDGSSKFYYVRSVD